MDTLWRDKLKHKEINETIQNTVKDMTRGSIQEILEVEEEGRTISSLDEQASVRNKLFPNDSIRESSLGDQHDDLQPSLLYSHPDSESQRKIEKPQPCSPPEINSFDNVQHIQLGQFRKNKDLTKIKSLDIEDKMIKIQRLHENYVAKEKAYKTEKKNLIKEDLEQIKISFLSQEDQEQEEIAGNNKSETFEPNKLTVNEAIEQKKLSQSDLSPCYNFEKEKETPEPIWEDTPNVCVNPTMVDSHQSEHSQENEVNLSQENQFVELSSKSNLLPNKNEPGPRNLVSEHQLDSIVADANLLSPENSKSDRKDEIQRSTEIPKKIKIFELPRIAISKESNKDFFQREEIDESIKSRNKENEQSIKYFLSKTPAESSDTQNLPFQPNISNNIISVETGSESNMTGLLPRGFNDEIGNQGTDPLFTKSESIKEEDNDLGQLNRSLLFSSDSSGQKEQTEPNDTEGGNLSDSAVLEKPTTNLDEMNSNEAISKQINKEEPSNKLQRDNFRKFSDMKKKQVFKKNKNPNFYSSFHLTNKALQNYNLNSAVLFRRNSEALKISKNNRTHFRKRIQKSLSPNHSKFIKEFEKKKKKTNITIQTKLQDFKESKSKLEQYTHTMKARFGKHEGRITGKNHNSHSYDFFARGKKKNSISEIVQAHQKKNKKSFTLNYKLRSLYSNVVPAKASKSRKKKKVLNNMNEYNFISEDHKLSISVDKKERRHKSQQNNLFKTINFTPTEKVGVSGKTTENFFRKLQNNSNKNYVKRNKKSPEKYTLKNFQSAHNILKGNYMEKSKNKIDSGTISAKKLKKGKLEKLKVNGFLQESFKNALKKKTPVQRDLMVTPTFNSFKKQFKKEYFGSNKIKSGLVVNLKNKK